MHVLWAATWLFGLVRQGVHKLVMVMGCCKDSHAVGCNMVVWVDETRPTFSLQCLHKGISGYICVLPQLLCSFCRLYLLLLQSAHLHDHLAVVTLLLDTHSSPFVVCMIDSEAAGPGQTLMCCSTHMTRMLLQ